MSLSQYWILPVRIRNLFDSWLRYWEIKNLYTLFILWLSLARWLQIASNVKNVANYDTIGKCDKLYKLKKATYETNMVNVTNMTTLTNVTNVTNISNIMNARHVTNDHSLDGPVRFFSDRSARLTDRSQILHESGTGPLFSSIIQRYGYWAPWDGSWAWVETFLLHWCRLAPYISRFSVLNIVFRLKT